MANNPVPIVLPEWGGFLEGILDAMSAPISVVSAGGQFIFINQAYADLFDIEKAELVGKPYTVHLKKDEISVHREVQATGKAVHGIKTKMGKKGLLVMAEGAPIIINGQLQASVAVISDFNKVNRIMELLKTRQGIITENGSLTAKYSFANIITNNPVMKEIIYRTKRAAMTSATILLRGESGTGKELFAHGIHQESSRHKNKFLRVNCASFPESLLESILFGYVGNAFTGADKKGQKGFFEEANGGTVFLDEIGEISLNLQTKLLRVLQEKEIIRVGGTIPVEVDIRIIAATNADLEHKMQTGTFREDLYYRLNVFPVTIPPLRERKEDIKLIADNLISKGCQEYYHQVNRIAEDYYRKLESYDWPGNVRELENVVARSLLNLEEEDTLRAEHIMFLKRKNLEPKQEVKEVNLLRTYRELFEDWERVTLEDIYNDCGKNKTKMAKQLNISVRCLYDKLQKLNIS